MDGTAPSSERIGFESPARFLGDLSPETTGSIIASAADIALIVEEGLIRDVAVGSDDLAREVQGTSWRGRAWIETVTVESRPKIEELLQVAPSSPAGWRQVNHPSHGGADVPIKYTAVRTGEGRPLVALGRDLRSVSRLQQRLVEAHQSLERDYSHLRAAEARYQLLFRSVSQPVLIVDPLSLALEEANPAVPHVLGHEAAALAGEPVHGFFASESQSGVARAIAEAASVGSSELPGARLGNGTACDVHASAFRAGDETRVIVQLAAHGVNGEATEPGASSQLLGVLEELPDGLVVAGDDLRILAANRTFVEMAQLVGRGQMVGGSLADFLGRSPTELNVLISSLKNHGFVRNFATVMRDRFGNEDEVEISAVAAPQRDPTTYGLSVRSVGRRLQSAPRIGESLPSSAEQLTNLVGRVPLREIVRESTDLIEKLCIEAALEITEDNRASAAEMLGLSRQGLYSKLRRFGIDDSR